MTVRLVAAAATDIDAMMTVMTTAFEPEFGEAWSAPQVLGSLATGLAWAQIAFAADATPLGFTLCRHVDLEAELLLIGVAPGARRGGVGRALLDAAAAGAWQRAATSMFLEVRDGNAAALTLYRAAGFGVIGRRRDYYRGYDGRRFDAITLRRSLENFAEMVR